MKILPLMKFFSGGAAQISTEMKSNIEIRKRALLRLLISLSLIDYPGELLAQHIADRCVFLGGGDARPTNQLLFQAQSDVLLHPTVS